MSAARAVRRIYSQPALSSQWVGEELSPGPGAASDSALAAYARAHVMPGYHQCGTCRMGVASSSSSSSSSDAVVDEQLRVCGVRGLRVVDAAVFPTVPAANLNANVLMIAELASELIINSSSK